MNPTIKLQINLVDTSLEELKKIVADLQNLSSNIEVTIYGDIKK